MAYRLVIRAIAHKYSDDFISWQTADFRIVYESEHDTSRQQRFKREHITLDSFWRAD